MAQDASERLKKDTKETADAIEREYRAAYASVKNNSKQASQQAGNNMRELGTEAKQNLAETLASFDGTVAGTINGIQGTLGGVTAGLTGVIPIIAAAAGAAGLGLITVAFQQQSAEAEKVKTQVAALAAEYIETGEIGKRSVDSMVEALRDLAISHEDGEQSLSALAQAAKDAGLPFDKIARAYVGNSDELEKLIKTNERHIESLLKERDEMQTGVDNYLTKTGALNEQADATEKLNETLGKNLEVTRAAEEAEAAYLASGGPAMEAKRDLISQINDAYDDTATSIDDYISKESGLFNVDKYIAAMEARSIALANYQDNLAKADLSPEAKKFLGDQGADAAAAFLAGYNKATPAQKAALNQYWAESAKENSGEYVKALQAGFTDKIKAPEIDTPDTSKADAALKRWASTTRTIKVQAELVDKYGRTIK